MKPRAKLRSRCDWLRNRPPGTGIATYDLLYAQPQTDQGGSHPYALRWDPPYHGWRREPLT